MSDAVLVALIGAIAAVTVGFMEWSRRSTKGAVAEVHHQVTANGGESAYDHQIQQIRQVASRLDHLGRDVRGIRADIGLMHETDRDLRAEIRSAVRDHEGRHHEGR